MESESSHLRRGEGDPSEAAAAGCAHDRLREDSHGNVRSRAGGYLACRALGQRLGIRGRSARQDETTARGQTRRQEKVGGPLEVLDQNEVRGGRHETFGKRPIAQRLRQPRELGTRRADARADPAATGPAARRQGERQEVEGRRTSRRGPSGHEKDSGPALQVLQQQLEDGRREPDIGQRGGWGRLHDAGNTHAVFVRPRRRPYAQKDAPCFSPRRLDHPPGCVLEHRRKETQGVLGRHGERLLFVGGSEEGRLQTITRRLQAQLGVISPQQPRERRRQQVRSGDDARPGARVDRCLQLGAADLFVADGDGHDADLRAPVPTRDAQALDATRGRHEGHLLAIRQENREGKRPLNGSSVRRSVRGHRWPPWKRAGCRPARRSGFWRAGCARGNESRAASG